MHIEGIWGNEIEQNLSQPASKRFIYLPTNHCMNSAPLNSLFDRVLAAAGAPVSLFLFLPLVVYVTNPNYVEIAKHAIVKSGLIITLATALLLFAVGRSGRTGRLILRTLQTTVLVLFVLILFPNETGEITGFETGPQPLTPLFATAKVLMVTVVGTLLALRFPSQLTVLANVVSVLVITTCVILGVRFTSAADAARNAYDSPSREFVELGYESNIIVLLLDTFTGYRFGEVLNEAPGLKRKFDGFVLYPNAIAPALNTVAGNSIVLTGDFKIALNEPGWLERNSESLARSFLTRASEKGYKTSYISNLKVLNEQIPAMAEYGFIPTRIATWQSDLESFLSFLTISFARVLPVEFAGLLGRKMSALFSSLGGNAETDFDVLDRLPGPAEKGPLKSKLAFESMVNELHVGPNMHSAIYFHSKISHPKWNFTEDGEYRSGAGWKSSSTYVAGAVGTFLDKLKSIDSFDNSLIIVASDHGGIPVVDPSLGGYFTRSEKFRQKFNPLVLIKPVHRQGALRTSKMTVWLGDIFPTVLEQLGLRSEPGGTTPSRSLLDTDDPARKIAVPLFFKPENQDYHSVLNTWNRVDVNGDFKDYGAIMKKSLAE